MIEISHKIVREVHKIWDISKHAVVDHRVIVVHTLLWTGGG